MFKLPIKIEKIVDVDDLVKELESKEIGKRMELQEEAASTIRSLMEMIKRLEQKEQEKEEMMEEPGCFGTDKVMAWDEDNDECDECWFKKYCENKCNVEDLKGECKSLKKQIGAFNDLHKEREEVYKEEYKRELEKLMGEIETKERRISELEDKLNKIKVSNEIESTVNKPAAENEIIEPECFGSDYNGKECSICNIKKYCTNRFEQVAMIRDIENVKEAAKRYEKLAEERKKEISILRSVVPSCFGIKLNANVIECDACNYMKTCKKYYDAHNNIIK